MPEGSFDPWRTLGVPVGARPEEIRRAFRRLARRRHPDVNRHSPHAHDEFILLRQAYETLMDDQMRSRLERDTLQGESDELIIVQGYDVALLDAYELLDHGYISEARALYLDLARNRPGDSQLLELLEAIRRAEGRVVTRSTAARAPAPPPPRTRPVDAWRDLWQPEPICVRWWLAGLAALVVAGCALLLRAVDAEAVVGPYALPEVGLAVLAGFVGAAFVAASHRLL